MSFPRLQRSARGLTSGAVLSTTIALLLVHPAPAQQADGTYVAENQALKIRLMPRTPEQIAAFYEGRGFPDRMIDVLREACFLTTTISNKSDRVIWHDLDEWRFTTPEGPVARYTRDQWKARWAKMDIPMSSQSTFRWTLLPDRLDFRPGESEGGNIVLPRTGHPVAIEARFTPGAEGEGAPFTLRFEDVRCAGSREAGS